MWRWTDSTGARIIKTIVSNNAAEADINALQAELEASQADITALQAERSHGKSIIATEQTTTSTSFVALTTPDLVSGVVVPEDGVLRVGFEALWKSSVEVVHQAAIFIGENQLKIHESGWSAPRVQAARLSNTDTGVYHTIFSFKGGLLSDNCAGQSVVKVATGQVLGLQGAAESEVNGSSVTIGDDDYYGGFVDIVGLPAGSYDVGVRYKTTSGTLSVKDRRLWVEAIGF